MQERISLPPLPEAPRPEQVPQSAAPLQADRQLVAQAVESHSAQGILADIAEPASTIGLMPEISDISVTSTDGTAMASGLAAIRHQGQIADGQAHSVSQYLAHQWGNGHKA